MIDQKNHYARYCELMALASQSAPARQQDGGYMSAIFILSADKALFDLALNKISACGINFSGIFSAARRAELSDSQYTAIRAAHSLFNGGSSSHSTPNDLAQCDYCTLDIITEAMYIWKCGRRPASDERGCLHFDRADELRRRAFELSFSAQFSQ
ncbi:MAG: hypothetical protein Q4F81_03965 [Eubacteriales bacterium]|nr:hypothetical protein [Eubacteriales bacterium]